MSEAIELRNLQKHFGTKKAVDGISLTIHEGELFSLLGVNGAGKTTTIRMLTGLSKPTGGQALVMGMDVEKELQEIKQIINLSPQETAVAPNLTVRENLEFIEGIYAGKKDKKASQEKVNRIIEEFHLEEVADRKAKLLSGGWQRRLSIAMAMITDPKIVFLDEPTLGLDVLARRELWSFVETLKGKITVILTTHYMEEAEALADRIAVMVDGRIQALGSVEELKHETGTANLEEAFIKIAEDSMKKPRKREEHTEGGAEA